MQHGDEHVKLLSADEAAKLLGYESTKSVIRLAAEIGGFKRGGQWVFPSNAIKAYLNAKSIQAGHGPLYQL